MNGPTILTLLRIALIPFILIFSGLGDPWNTWVSLGIFLAASLTDWLDGYLARRNNQVTMLGKLLDPLADKLLVLTALLVLLENRHVPAWLVIFMIGREMAITGLRAFLAAERIVLAAGQLGKVKMVFQVIALSFLFLSDVEKIFNTIGLITAYVALFFSMLSAFRYVADFWQLLGEKIMAEQNQKGANHDGS
ncbi:CDP-diacylglycerol--glycerol-3-phosphate 3-phosphatidyltransferase [Acanthopleuribacter pedis]|uniref:CDP-diacylglycerol--glycerol-3-phosphate 3-phosphatidyltransferase n=1 Tax=Acanthopleuribacter pedis TaxID=442870 RepID=A0A8J7QK84_9BACT|nr:CDP-diacylglycerol--glycerol-3-phosphate 3-phosphatidyltransferase [Acanthopleuribacter pedis]MBO1321500.1 CDP-diacylglycerol--glycerol-3-phosphate 3-phosphatidyltransferase [Acanthopleuribacter pedis]